MKLFGKWSLQDVNVSDITLVDYVAVKDKCAKYLPHSAGRYQVSAHLFHSWRLPDDVHMLIGYAIPKSGLPNR